MGTNRFTGKFPPGAIRTSAELLDLVIEARKERKAIRLYLVEQMGYIREFYLTSKSRYMKNKDEVGTLCKGPAFNKVTGFVDHSIIGYRKTNDRWFRSYLLMGSYDIDGSSDYSTEHRAFTNRRHAENYSKELRNDQTYVRQVHEHWARCYKLFRDF